MEEENSDQKVVAPKVNIFERLRNRIPSIPKKLMALLFILVAIPVTLVLALNQQTFFNHAAGPNDVNTINSATDLADFSKMRDNWRKYLTGTGATTATTATTATDATDATAETTETTQVTPAAQADQILALMSTMHRDKPYLWDDNKTTNNGFGIVNSYQNLYVMSLAYSKPTSSYYNNAALLDDINFGLEWLNSHWYNANSSETSDNGHSPWYEYEISTPLVLENIAVLLYDNIPSAHMTKYMAAIDNFYPPSPTAGAFFAANRAWIAKVVFLNGIISNDRAKVNKGKNLSYSLFDTATGTFDSTNPSHTVEGMHSDGSFIMHYAHPYNGHYGLGFLDSIRDLFYISSGTTNYDYDLNYKNKAYGWILNSFEPFNFKGEIMDMVRGRVISYQDDQDQANRFINDLLAFSKFYNDDRVTKLQSIAKRLVAENTFTQYNPLPSVKDLWTAVQENPNIVKEPDPNFFKTFPQMDRAVAQRPNWAVGISMYSKRIYNYESINGNNLRGWYTGDGALYMYTDQDLGQFSDNYWVTVDPYKIPGTTEDTLPRGQSEGARTTSPNSWVGGVSLNDKYGSAGMLFQSWNKKLNAKKSWFVFDNEVVALGSGITGGTNNQHVLTTVENRKINTPAVDLIINNVKEPVNLGWSSSVNASWAYLQGFGGYYFPNSTTLTASRITRTGSSSDIDGSGKSTPSILNNYVTLVIDHGINPSNASYAYVLLPNYTSDAVSAYSQNPDVTILTNGNNNTVAAVKENKLGITAANFWNSGSVSFLTANSPLSVMAKEEPGLLTVSVSDPTQSQSQVSVDIDLTKLTTINAQSTLTKVKSDPQISRSTPTANVLRLTVNTSGALGKSFTIVLSGGATSTPTPTPSPTPTSSPTVTPTPRLTSTPTPTRVPSPTPATLAGDYDQNGIVNLADYNVWLAEFQGTVSTHLSDGNGDGIVDLLDYNIWQANYHT